MSISTPQTPNNDKVKILVLGDTGVGKTSLLHLLCHQKVLQKPQWTIGAHFEVLEHKYKQHPSEFFIEFWDIGGAKKFALSRHLFYKDSRSSGPKWNCPNSGLILVHDLSNKKSYDNLKRWVDEVNEVIDDNQFTWDSPPTKAFQSFFSIFQNFTSTSNNNILDFQFRLPVLVIGNKLDLVKQKGLRIDAEELGEHQIHVSALDPTTFAEGSQAIVKMGAFFDKVIYQQHFKNQHHMHRLPSPGVSSPFNPNPPRGSQPSFYSPNRSVKQPRKIDTSLLKVVVLGEDDKEKK